MRKNIQTKQCQNRTVHGTPRIKLTPITTANNVSKSNSQSSINDLAAAVLEKFGPANQAIILIEEMSELTKALCKMQRGKLNRNNLNEEFSHVLISCEVIRRLIGITQTDIDKQVKAKLAEYGLNASKQPTN